MHECIWYFKYRSSEHTISFVNDPPALVNYSPLLITLLDLSLLFLISQINVSALQDLASDCCLWSTICFSRVFSILPFPPALRGLLGVDRGHVGGDTSATTYCQYHLNVTWNEHMACFIGMLHFISCYHTIYLNGLSAKHAELQRNNMNFSVKAVPHDT